MTSNSFAFCTINFATIQNIELLSFVKHIYALIINISSYQHYKNIFRNHPYSRKHIIKMHSD
jgi:hypothetical protein